MIVPLSWLAEYVKLPKDTKVLTDRLTAIGHMLDKTKDIGGEKIIDLELRGNRADMFGLYGVAREVAAAIDTPLKNLEVLPLPKKDRTGSLVRVEESAKELVLRYEALKLKVKIGPSPEFIKKRLGLFGVPSINNVVDITNYVMLETGEPMHAFDAEKIAGGQLILRRAKNAEHFETIAQGQAVKLTTEDLVISDDEEAQALTMIGGLHSKVTENTQEIILEAAVYNQANVRRTARRLKIFTESGLRHEKHLDPNQVELTLGRAVYLLEQHAEAKVVGLTSDYYPQIVKPKTISFDTEEVARLCGIEIDEDNVEMILQRLEFGVDKNKITVPTFRTDIEQPADIVEEIIRIYGYDKIPSTPIADAMPLPQTYPSFTAAELLRDQLTKLGINEVITLPFVTQETDIKLVNPPDPERSYLRQDVHGELVAYAQKLRDLNQERVAIFEIGKVFFGKSGKYQEENRLAIAISGQNNVKTWNSNPEKFTIYHLLGMLQALQATEYQIGETDGVFWAEMPVKLPAMTNPYQIASSFPPIIEDVNVELTESYIDLISKIKKISPLIKQITLIDKYDSKLTLRITYHSDTRQLTNGDVAPVREKLLSLGV